MNLKFLSKKTIKVAPISIISFLLFSNLISIIYIQSPLYTLIQYICLLIVFMYVVSKAKYVRAIDMLFLIPAFIMMACIVISSYLNHINSAALRESIYYAMLNFTMCMFLVEAGNTGKLDKLLLGGKIYLLILLTINDLLMIFMPRTFYNISGRDIGTTLLGNKFNVAYAHLILMFLLIYEEKNEKKRDKKVVAYVILVSVLCVFVECTTSLLASWVFLVLYFLPKNIKKIASNPLMFAGVFFLTAFLLLLFNGILEWAPIRYLIVDVLQRDITLTGRMNVYGYIYSIVSKSKWWGYGYGTDIVLRVSTWYANAQNALWDFIIRYGFITAITLFIYTMISVCKYFAYNLDCLRKRNWLIFAMLYVYLFIGIGEIVFNKQFFFFVALLWASCSTRRSRKGI